MIDLYRPENSNARTWHATSNPVTAYKILFPYNMQLIDYIYNYSNASWAGSAWLGLAWLVMHE